MPGGGLVVLDRSGQDVKRYSLCEGMATLGSDVSCDIRVLLPSVSGHHATVAVRPAQTIIRNVSDSETLVNGQPVSVAALRHGDVITLGGRSLRWEYDDPAAVKLAASPPTAMVKRVVKMRVRRRVSDARPRLLDPDVRLLMEMKHRNSMPANGGGKQVAVVQPQRRDNHGNIDINPRLVVKPHRPYAQVNRRRRNSKLALSKHDNNAFISEKLHGSKSRTSTSKPSPDLQNTTKATLWIESRKTSPRKSMAVAENSLIPRTVLKKTVTPNLVSVATQAKKSLVTRVAKIQAPSTIDHTKQAALMLITGHSNKSKTVSPNKVGKPRSKKTLQSDKKSPKSDKTSSQGAQSVSSSRRSKEVAINAEVKPNSKRSSRSFVRESSVQVPEYSKKITILETSDSDPCQARSRRTVDKTLPSPRKSSMKDPKAKKGIRKSESIKFDFSNLDNSNNTDVSDTKSLQSSKIFEKSPGFIAETTNCDIGTLTPESPSARRSIRSGAMVQKTLASSGANNLSRYSDRITRSVSDENSTIANMTKTLSPRSPKHMESYSVVDLVSIDSNESRSSVYNSIRSESTAFGTPIASARRTRSNFEPSLLAASTPQVGKTPSKRRSKSLTTTTESTSFTTKRSSSVFSPENDKRQIPKSTRLTRASRRTLNDSEILILSANESRPSKTSKISSGVEQRSSISILEPPRILSPKSYIISNQPELSFFSSNSSDSSEISSSIRRSKSFTTPARERTSKRSSSVSCIENDKRSNTTRLSRASTKNLIDRAILILSENEGRSSKTSKKSFEFSKRSSISIPESPSILNQKSLTSIQGSASILNPKSLGNSDRSKISSDTSKISASKSPRVSATNSPKDVKSPRVPVAKSPRVSSKSPMSKAHKSPAMSSSKKVTETSLIVPGSPVADGLHTPDNAHSPQEQGTPVLNIQSLLNPSDSSLHLKNLDARGSQSAPRRGRSRIKSKSLNLNVNKQVSQRMSKDSSNASDRTDKEAPKPTNEKTITPKSTVKLSPMAVKGKHSTAKKPQSKRLLIDDMEDSDIVKSFFNSPVKRKLSQSMTEFSRTQLFEDNTETRSESKRPRRAVLYIRHQDQSDFNRSEAYTPESFVSTLETSTKSPNVSGVKKLNRNSDRDSKSLPLRTRKSPKNRLSDFIGDKEIFTSACSPKNDLRRVSGVKSLFQTKLTRNSTKNDLTDVRGIKRLYQEKSPINDLRNVSGLKKTITRHSPKNDLRDVRGVKRLFTREKSKDGLHDLSGVEELFDTSFDSHKNSRNQSALQSSKNSMPENSFDQLIGKPRAKVTCASNRSDKTLNVSLDQISNNVEEWLEKESRKNVTVSKVSTSERRQSIDKFETSPKPIARELANLATDTVEGSAPVTTSRNRMGTMTKSTILIHSTPVKNKSVEKLGVGSVSPAICLPEAFVRIERLVLPSSKSKLTRPDVPLNILVSKGSARTARCKKLVQEISYTEKLEDTPSNRGRRNAKEGLQKPETKKNNPKKATRGQIAKKVASPEARHVKKLNSLKSTSQGRQVDLSKTNKEKATVAQDLTSPKQTSDQKTELSTVVTQSRVKNIEQTRAIPNKQARQIRVTMAEGSVAERLSRKRTNLIDQQISEKIIKPKRGRGPSVLVEEKCEEDHKTEQIQNASQKVQTTVVTRNRVKNIEQTRAIPNKQARQTRVTMAKGSVTERLSRNRTNLIDQQISEKIIKPDRGRGPSVLVEEKCEEDRKTEQIQNASQKVQTTVVTRNRVKNIEQTRAISNKQARQTRVTMAKGSVTERLSRNRTNLIDQKMSEKIIKPERGRGPSVLVEEKCEEDRKTEQIQNASQKVQTTVVTRNRVKNIEQTRAIPNKQARQTRVTMAKGSVTERLSRNRTNLIDQKISEKIIKPERGRGPSVLVEGKCEEDCKTEQIQNASQKVQTTVVTRNRVKNIEQTRAIPNKQARQTRVTMAKGSVTERLSRNRTNLIDQQISEKIIKPERGRGTSVLVEEKCEEDRKTDQIQNASQKVQKSLKRGCNAQLEKPQTQLDSTPEVKPKRGRSASTQVALKEPNSKVQKRNAKITEVEIPTKTTRGRNTKLVETTKVTRSGKSSETTKGDRQKSSVQVFEKQTQRGQNVGYTKTRNGKMAKEAIAEAVLKGINAKNEPGPSTVKVSALAKRAVVAKTIVSPVASVRRIRSTWLQNAARRAGWVDMERITQADGVVWRAIPVKSVTRQSNAASKASALPR